MILVMGVTGSGKSHFINTLVGRDAAKEYRGLRSGIASIRCVQRYRRNALTAPGTRDCQIVQANIGNRASVSIVDTPGFDDTERDDAEVLALITSCLATQYQLGIPLRGIIYLHRIIDPRMQGHALRNLQIFEKICGEGAFRNVVLMTTMWDLLPEEGTGYRMDQELRDDFWSMMAANGSYITRFDGSKDTAVGMVVSLLSKPPIVLDIQRQLEDNKIALHETTAGRFMLPELDRRLHRTDEALEVLEKRIAQAERARDRAEADELARRREEQTRNRRREERARARMERRIAEETEAKIAAAQKKCSRQSRTQIFATVTNLTVSTVFNLLSLFGVSVST